MDVYTKRQTATSNIHSYSVRVDESSNNRDVNYFNHYISSVTKIGGFDIKFCQG